MGLDLLPGKFCLHDLKGIKFGLAEENEIVLGDIERVAFLGFRYSLLQALDFKVLRTGLEDR